MGLACHRLWTLLGIRELCTEAQAYPPHCTLTGFFDADPVLRPELIARAQRVVEGHHGGIQLAPLDTGEWIGLTIDAPEWVALAEEFARACDDLSLEQLRPKHRLHVSLAYGNGLQHERHAHLVQHIFAALDLRDVTWTLGLWTVDGEGERPSAVTTDRWERHWHAAWPTEAP